MKPVKHPAKFTPVIIDTIRDQMVALVANMPVPVTVLDPFGGVGGIFDITKGWPNVHTSMVEIEKEWADVARARGEGQVYCADFFKWARNYFGMFNFIITSCTYGNRMADHHEAKEDSKRNTYRHVLGRPLSENSSAAMQWGAEYRTFHRDAWKEVYMLTMPGGYFILNVKDHIRKDAVQPVSMWHKTTIKAIGFESFAEIKVPVKGNRQGANGEVRVDYENVYVFQKPWQKACDKAGKEALYAQPKLGA